MKKLLSLVLMAALLLSCVAFTASAEATEAVISYSITDDPQQMDPTLNSYARSSVVLQNLFVGLYKLGPDGETYIPACATDYTVSDDGLTYTFTIREGLKWSDGTDLNANDFEYSWKRVLDPELASPTCSDLWVIENGKEYSNGECSADEVGVKALDDYTLEVKLDYLAPWFPSLTATTCYFPVQKATVEANENWTASVDTYVSNGPFKLVEYSSLDKLVYEKNEYYFDAENVQIDKVIYYIIADSTAELTAYEQGTLNVMDDLDASSRDKYGATDEYYMQSKVGIQYWDFNCQLPEFADNRVRKAFAMAIPRQTVLDACQLTAEQPVYGFIPTSQPSLTGGESYRADTGDLFTEDQEAAKALFDEATAGADYMVDGKFPTVKIVCQNSDEQKTAAQVLGDIWASVLGIEYEIWTPEQGYWDELANGNFSVGRNGYTCDYLDPSANLKIWVTGSNCSENGWDDPVYDEMVNAASQIVDGAEREAALQEAEAYLVDQMPGMPMYTMVDDYLVKSNVKGVIKNKIGHIFFEYATIEG